MNREQEGPPQIRWEAGEELPAKRFPPVTRLDLIRYAGASGDYNPIHTIDEEAAKAGLPGVIAHGMLTMGRMAAVLSPWWGEGFLLSFRNRFSGMVFLGDEITVRAKVEETASEEEGKRIRLRVEAVNQKDETVCKGKLEFRLGAKPAPAIR